MSHGSRVCRACGTERPEREFGKYVTRTRERRRKTCNVCRRAAQKKRYAENPHVRAAMKRTASEAHLRKTYGISIEQKDRIVVSYEGRCPICKTERKLGIDHDHATGRVRGALCSSCNMALGLLKDNTVAILAAATYLETDRFVAWLDDELQSPEGERSVAVIRDKLEHALRFNESHATPHQAAALEAGRVSARALLTPSEPASSTGYPLRRSLQL